MAMKIIPLKTVKNNSHDSSYKRPYSKFLVDKTYWTVAFRISVLVSTYWKWRVSVKIELLSSRNLRLTFCYIAQKGFSFVFNEGVM